MTGKDEPTIFEFFMPAEENERFSGTSPDELIGDQITVNLLDGRAIGKIIEAEIQEDPHGLNIKVAVEPYNLIREAEG